LVVRTLPNDPGKRYRLYEGPCPAAYFTADAMHWVVERGVTSLVVDLPSLDRADDGGSLTAHRVFWGLAPDVLDAHQARRGRALVTELAYVPDAVHDGLYLLDLHVPAFATDAAPSRPVLYPLRELAP
jgi:kynurenine formamidase